MSEKRATRVRNKYKYDVPLWHRPILSVAEATEYFGIDRKRKLPICYLDRFKESY